MPRQLAQSQPTKYGRPWPDLYGALKTRVNLLKSKSTSRLHEVETDEVQTVADLLDYIYLKANSELRQIPISKRDKRASLNTLLRSVGVAIEECNAIISLDIQAFGSQKEKFAGLRKLPSTLDAVLRDMSKL